MDLTQSYNSNRHWRWFLGKLFIFKQYKTYHL